MATYTLQTNITNNATNCGVYGSQFGGSVVTYDLVTTTVAGTYLYNDLWVRPDSGYEFTNITDLTYEVNGSPYDINSGGNVGAVLTSGKIHIISVAQVPPDTTITITITGTPSVIAGSGVGSGLGAGTTTTTSGVANTGYGHVFNGVSQSILIRHNSNFDILNSYDDWSVSFWASLPPQQPGSDSEQLIVSKQVAESYPNSYGNIVTRNNEAAAYPFKIGVYTATAYSDEGKVFFETSDGIKTTRIESPYPYNDGLYRQYTFNKSGSFYEIWVAGNRIASQSVSYKNINNKHDILIGNNTYGGGNAFSGSIDEFRIRRTSLSQSEIESLADTNVVSGSFLQKNHVGYVYYKQGMIVVTDPRPRYQNIFLGDGNWDYTNKTFQLDYRATKVVEEVSVLCELGKGEFNVSSNPSIRLTSNEYDPRLKPLSYDSTFRPYITQIGLYNDTGDLLAIAKLGSPLKKRQDVDVTINVKFDID